MSKNSLFQPAIILCLICLLTVGLVALTYGATAAARNEQEIIAANANRLSMFPEAIDFSAITSPDIAQYDGISEAVQAKADGGKLLGYLVTAHERGYGGEVPVMIAFSPDFKILRLKVLSNDETPGLGKKVELDFFTGQFANQGIKQDFSVKPNDSGRYIIDAVSGATISSRAVTSGVNVAVQFIRKVQTEVK